jgi:mRNA-degrading endonuclease RelE of RelBE toxin-antitoxin system
MQVEFRKKFLKELSKLPNPYQSDIEEFIFDILPNYNNRPPA